MRGFLTRLALITAAAALLMTLWSRLSAPPSSTAGPMPGPATVASLPRTVDARGDLAADEQSTIALFEATRDSVVFISTAQRVSEGWSRNVLTVPRGSGSGFVWDDKGHVVTNFHVIDGASEASVRLSDGRDYKAALVGVSPDHDIAVLRIGVDFKRPPPVPVGRSNNLKVGQKVFAIGNPFGLDWTLTTGIISALNRSLAGERSQAIDHLIQTDAAINPGNSGGPLLDSAGRLIGINTAIYSPSGASAGIGFAVPVDTVNRVVPQLITKGRYLRPSLGVSSDDDLNQRLTEAMGIKGVVLLQVNVGSAAAKAGLQGARFASDGRVVPGDVIVAVGQQPVDSVAQLVSRLDELDIGSRVTLGVLRAGKTREVEVVLQPGS
jgi:S1-C subfamily serine protease